MADLDQQDTGGDYTQQTFEYSPEATTHPEETQHNNQAQQKAQTQDDEKISRQPDQNSHLNKEQDSETDYENPDVMLTTHRIPPLKPLHNMPRTRLNFDLDPEERAIIAKAETLTREEIWQLLEKKRFEELKFKAIQLSGAMLTKARCPICTLLPPCKHYDSQEQIVSEASKLVNQPEFKRVFPPHKRDNLLFQLKKQLSPQNSNMITHQNSRVDSINYFNSESQAFITDPDHDPLLHSNMGNRKGSFQLYPSHSPSYVEFLKRGRGHGGSPTNFEVKQDASLKYIKLDTRHPSVVTMRKRSHQGSYQYSQASIGGHQLLTEQEDLRKRQELEQRQQIQQEIATYREIRFQKEQERLLQEAQQVEEQRQRIKEQNEKRKAYMEHQKQKLEAYRQNIGQQYAHSRHVVVDQQAQIMSERNRNSPKGQNSTKAKAIQNYKQDKQKAEQMLSFPVPPRKTETGKDRLQSRQSPALQRAGFSLENDQEEVHESPKNPRTPGDEESDLMDEDKIEVQE